MTMFNSKRAAIGLAALTFVGTGWAMTAAPAAAHGRVAGWTASAPDVYQGPGGTYNSLADYTRSVEGTPCGMNCTRDAQMRWGLARH